MTADLISERIEFKGPAPQPVSAPKLEFRADDGHSMSLVRRSGKVFSVCSSFRIHGVVNVGAGWRSGTKKFEKF